MIIPEVDHRVDEKWPGLTKQQETTLRRCLERHVTLRVHGESRDVLLVPRIGNPSGPPIIRTPDLAVGTGATIEGIWMIEAVQNSKSLRASSDLSRVKVTRQGSEKLPGFEKVFDLRSVQPPNILWLRDGDIIEVPDKE